MTISGMELTYLGSTGSPYAPYPHVFLVRGLQKHRLLVPIAVAGEFFRSSALEVDCITELMSHGEIEGVLGTADDLARISERVVNVVYEAQEIKLELTCTQNGRRPAQHVSLGKRL